jgi:adenine-specific DNA-methyltransferase
MAVIKSRPEATSRWLRASNSVKQKVRCWTQGERHRRQGNSFTFCSCRKPKHATLKHAWHRHFTPLLNSLRATSSNNFPSFLPALQTVFFIANFRMPTLHWVGKDKVINHHHEVPFRVLNKVSTFCAPAGLPTNSTGNRIIHGDNLEALKSLLPEFEGRVKCIYIDPPYNTGNEGWVYNDAVNDPKMKRWLGQVVGKEGEDLSRHDKWLCMMYPRLKLLHRLLADDGAIFVSIDDVEVANLRLVLDEIFGSVNFVANVVWQKRYVANVTAKFLSDMHDHVLIYAKKASCFSVAKIPRTDDQEADYKNPDDDLRGPWRAQDLSASKPYSAGQFPITGPNGDIFNPPPRRYWRMNRQQYDEWLVDGRITFGKSGTGRPMLKRFLTETQAGLTPHTWWTHEFAGHNKESTLELKKLFDGESPFDTPKPLRLIGRVLDLVGDPNALVLDSFAGSGTTAHAVLQRNAQDNGQRRFILIETESYAETITAERIRRVIAGYGKGTSTAGGLGGGFDYYTVGEAMFTSDDNLNETVGTEAIRGYVAYSEGIPATDRASAENPHSPYLLGLNRETAWIFHYEPERATSLDMDFLSGLRFGGDTGASKPATVIIYADRCLLSAPFMARHGIIFKKIPRDITRF